MAFVLQWDERPVWPLQAAVEPGGHLKALSQVRLHKAQPPTSGTPVLSLPLRSLSPPRERIAPSSWPRGAKRGSATSHLTSYKSHPVCFPGLLPGPMTTQSWGPPGRRAQPPSGIATAVTPCRVAWSERSNLNGVSVCVTLGGKEPGLGRNLPTLPRGGPLTQARQGVTLSLLGTRFQEGGKETAPLDRWL